MYEHPELLGSQPNSTVTPAKQEETMHESLRAIHFHPIFQVSHCPFNHLPCP